MLYVDATGVHEVVEDGAAEDLATREGDELYRTDDITYIRQETSTPQDDSTGYICVGLLNKSNKGYDKVLTFYGTFVSISTRGLLLIKRSIINLKKNYKPPILSDSIVNHCRS